jgi:hypothetical protein
MDTATTETKPTEMVTTSTETVEKPEDVKAELARVQAALKEANNEAAARRKKLEAFEAAEAKRKEGEMTELQKAQAKLAEYEAKVKQHERKEAQTAAAVKAGLPAAFADRLKGETPEELEADAKQLLEALPKADVKKPTPTISATNPGGASGGLTQEQRDAQAREWIGGAGVSGLSGGGFSITEK